MKTLNPYLNFSGRCQEALDFYTQAFNGKVLMRQTFGQAPNAIAGINPSLIMHAEFQAEGIYFMATDGMSPETPASSNIVTLNIGFDDPEEQITVFTALQKGGEEIMPLNDTFWGARFGIVKDPFGIHWMLNCQLEK
jgi:PhnB protein